MDAEAESSDYNAEEDAECTADTFILNLMKFGNCVHYKKNGLINRVDSEGNESIQMIKNKTFIKFLWL